MIISNSHQFIFIHLHKTGGTSISATLDPTLQWNDIICGGSQYGNLLQSYYEPRFGLNKHCDAETVMKVVGTTLWEDYFTFSWVRNPYSRVVSLYTWLDMLIKQRRFRRFVRFLDRRSEFWQWPGVRAYLATHDFSSFIRNEDFIRRAPGAKPMFDSLSAQGKLLVDFVGRVENMSGDFSKVAQRIGLDGLKMKRRNVSKQRGQLSSYYRDQEDLDLVYELCRVDFEMFDYPALRYRELDGSNV